MLNQVRYPNGIVVTGRKRHACFGWCGERIIGVTMNRRLNQRSTYYEDIRTELSCRRPLLMGPGHTLICQHGRLYFVRQVPQ